MKISKQLMAALKKKAMAISSKIDYQKHGLPPLVQQRDTASSDFLCSAAWKALRKQAIQKYGSTCLKCHKVASKRYPVNIDHVKPRKHYPELALDIDNLQPLCGPCNKAKGNQVIDYRNSTLGKPMTEIYRDKHLLKLAQDQLCLLRIPNFCRGGSVSTVACHHNSARSGKGMGIKASDAYTVWGCFGCHQWLDQGSASKDDKEAAFQAAHLLQVAEWHKIASSIATRPWKVEAAKAVLNHLENNHG